MQEEEVKPAASFHLWLPPCRPRRIRAKPSIDPSQNKHSYYSARRKHRWDQETEPDGFCVCARTCGAVRRGINRSYLEVSSEVGVCVRLCQPLALPKVRKDILKILERNSLKAQTATDVQVLLGNKSLLSGSCTPFSLRPLQRVPFTRRLFATIQNVTFPFNGNTQ